jgi:hypothetical protein
MYQCCGSESGIRCFFNPRIRDPDPGWTNGRIWIRDKTSWIRDKTSRIRNTGMYVPPGRAMSPWSLPDTVGTRTRASGRNYLFSCYHGQGCGSGLTSIRIRIRQFSSIRIRIHNRTFVAVKDIRNLYYFLPFLYKN